MARESEVMELHAGFRCRGLGIALGSRRVAGTNENKGKEVEDKKLRLLESLEISLKSLKSL